MVITFIIGNGFDIGLGLKTRYKDFYPYFIEKASDNNIIKSYLKDDTENEFINWSDLEIKLGEITDSYSNNHINKFIEDKIELDELLKDYLIEEEKKFTVNDEYMKKVNVGINSIKRGNNEAETIRINRVFDSRRDEGYYYKAVTFNYTNCLDKIWVKDYEVGNHKYGINYKSEVISDLIHIHGTLEDNDMIIGVNDEEQIANNKFKQDNLINRVMIKQKLNIEIGENKTEKVKNIINESRVVCLYGVSIGDTDGIWWQHLGEWLKRNSDNILLIYNYDERYRYGHPVRRFMHVDTIKDYFLNKTQLSNEEKTKVRNNIFIFDNNMIFSK